MIAHSDFSTMSFKLFYKSNALLLFTLYCNKSNARSVTGPIEINKDSCYDVGFVDWSKSAGECQLQCTLAAVTLDPISSFVHMDNSSE